MLEKLSDLSKLTAPGTFGAHHTAMIWMIVASALMYLGPSLFVLFYQLYDFRGKSTAKPDIIDFPVRVESSRRAS